MVHALFISHCCIPGVTAGADDPDASNKLPQMRLSFSPFTRMFRYDDSQAPKVRSHGIDCFVEVRREWRAPWAKPILR
jgi:hypothetical protein